MEELKTLGTEYPYREEDFATPEHMESMLLDLAALRMASSEIAPRPILTSDKALSCEEMARCIVGDLIRKSVYKYLDGGKAGLLGLKHICSAPTVQEARRRYIAIDDYGFKYFESRKYQCIQTPLNEVFSEGFEFNAPF